LKPRPRQPTTSQWKPTTTAAARDTALEAAAEAARTARPAQRSARVAALQIDRQQRCRVMTDFAPSAAMLGTMPGARERGRPRTAWMDNIKTWTGLSVEKSIRMTEDRDTLYMEKVRPRCGQPSDRGRLKNRTEQPQSSTVSK